MKYIIDTDPGIDDAIAILLGYLNKLDIVGFTLATGNIEFEKSLNNIKIIEDLLDSNIKIYEGSLHNKGNVTAKYAHGIDGLGYAVFPKSNRKTEKMYAEDFMIKASKKYKDNLTIICLGPLTNLANALRKDKTLAQRVSKIVIMGVSDDDHLYREFNVKVDPIAAKKVLAAPFKRIEVVTHETGIKTFISKRYINTLKESEDIISRFVYLISLKYIEFSMEHHHVNGLTVPDPLTVASVVDDKIISFKPCKIKIDVGDPGVCHVEKLKNSNTYISTDVNQERFSKLFKNTFK